MFREWNKARVYVTVLLKSFACRAGEKNLKVALRIFHSQEKTEWNTDVHWFQLAFNSAWHEATETTPANFFFDRQLNHLLELRWKLDELLAVPRGPDQIRNERKTAATNLKLARQRRERLYNRNCFPNPFN